jgi:hypothetical protein
VVAGQSALDADAVGAERGHVDGGTRGGLAEDHVDDSGLGASRAVAVHEPAGDRDVLEAVAVEVARGDDLVGELGALGGVADPEVGFRQQVHRTAGVERACQRAWGHHAAECGGGAGAGERTPSSRIQHCVFPHLADFRKETGWLPPPGPPAFSPSPPAS